MQNQNFHFLVTNHYGWVSTTTERNLADAIELTKSRSKGMTQPYYDVWYVPVPSDAEYEIDQYKPLVNGAVCVGHFDLPKSKK